MTAIHGVTIDHAERRELRAQRQPPPGLVPNPNSGWGQFVSRDPYVTISEPIPGTARLHAAPHVPWPLRDASPADSAPPRGLTGYLVELDAD